MKKALLCGINYLNTQYELAGCVNDVGDVDKVLQQCLTFESYKNRRMLINEAATASNIRAELEWLVDGADSGDVLYFHYSGHGSQVRTVVDVNSESDGWDEVICPVDFDWASKLIFDDELRQIFSKVPADVNLTVVLDCCHSGTGTDAAEIRSERSTRSVVNSNERSRSIVAPRWAVSKPKTSKNYPSRGLLISGCADHQLSHEIVIGGRPSGAATHALLKSLKLHSYRATASTVVKSMGDIVATLNVDQTPTVSGDVTLYNRIFLT